MISRFSRWPPSWIAEWNDLSNSESLCSSVLSIKFWFNPTYSLGGDVVNASHQVSANSDLLFGRRCPLKIFKMATMAAILDIRTEGF